MELKNYEKLQILTAKTSDLHKKMKEKMNEQRFRLCSHCFGHGRYCVVDERERLIAISDSLKELHNLLMILSGEVANHKRQSWDEALARVEESRKVVRERARRWAESGGVIAEVVHFLGESLWEILDDKKQKQKQKQQQLRVNGIYRFLVGTARFGLDFFVVFATIYASLEFARISGKHHKDEDVSHSRIQQQPRSDVSLDVLCGRG